MRRQRRCDEWGGEWNPARRPWSRMRRGREISGPRRSAPTACDDTECHRSPKASSSATEVRAKIVGGGPNSARPPHRLRLSCRLRACAQQWRASAPPTPNHPNQGIETRRSRRDFESEVGHKKAQRVAAGSPLRTAPIGARSAQPQRPDFCASSWPLPWMEGRAPRGRPAALPVGCALARNCGARARHLHSSFATLLRLSASSALSAFHLTCSAAQRTLVPIRGAAVAAPSKQSMPRDPSHPFSSV